MEILFYMCLNVNMTIKDKMAKYTEETLENSY